MQIFNCHTN